PRLFVTDTFVDESDGNALVEVLLGGTGGQSSLSTVTVDYTTSNGTATAGADYGAVSGTLSFAPGQTVKTIVVPIIDDAIAERDADFRAGRDDQGRAGADPRLSQRREPGVLHARIEQPAQCDYRQVERAREHRRQRQCRRDSAAVRERRRGRREGRERPGRGL